LTIFQPEAHVYKSDLETRSTKWCTSCM